MYPRVMVRNCEDKTPVEEETSSYLVSYMESLSLEGHCSSRTTCPGGASKSDPPRHAKNVKPPPRSSLSASPVSKAKNNKDVDVDITKHIRASSLPRPRAVLSSPDNDDIIGNLNELKRKRETVTVLELQNHKNHAQENDEIIGNLNELNRKKQTATVLEMQNHKNHAQAASKIPTTLNQLSQKGATPLRTRPLGQNRHAQVTVSPADVRLTTPRKTREIMLEGCKNAASKIPAKLNQLSQKGVTPLKTCPLGQNKHALVKVSPALTTPRKTREIMLEGCKNTDWAEKPASDSPLKLRPTIRSRTIEIALNGCRKNNLREKSASDSALRLKPNIRSRTPIATQGCENNNLVEASELVTPRLRPSVGRVQGAKNNNLVEASKLSIPSLRPSPKRV